MSDLRIPTALYRLQFNREFGFSRARTLVPYLHELGISDLYASPLLAARQGSPHGYDVTDPTRLNTELGSGDDFAGLAGALRQRGMGLLLDIVPNHMAASGENPWWWNVLRHGSDSLYANYFDIHWQPARPGMSGKVLLPVLGEPFGRVLEKGDFKLGLAEDGLRVCYFERCLPLSPVSSVSILTRWLKELTGIFEPEHQAVLKLVELIGLLHKIWEPDEQGQWETASRCWHDLYNLYNSLSDLKTFIDRQLAGLSGSKGDPTSFNRLEEILGEQNYRLAFWRVANREINYRRFFDVSDLVSMRVEEEQVFEATHSFIFNLAGAGQVTGLRIDHVDGLHDPKAYLDRLQERLAGQEKGSGFYVVVEKILAEDEELPDTWQVFGTTGYDFLNIVNGLFVDHSGAGVLNELYAETSGLEENFSEVVYRQKIRVMKELFTGEFSNLARRLESLAVLDRHGRDLTLAELEHSLIEVTACLGVYRTYTNSYKVRERDRAYIEQALSEAARRTPSVDSACAFLSRVLLLEYPESMPGGLKQEWLDFVMRWQQVTGPVMAKGYEDTALYIYNRLVSLNEVAGEPGTVGISVAEFHRRNKAGKERRPHTINASSTHDTKRSEDVRARINVLSEIPAYWAERVKAWRDWNRSGKPEINGRPVPAGNTELLIYQTLVGAWPLSEEEMPSVKDRLKDYLVKASREAKVDTSWLNPRADYEQALQNFVKNILETPGENRFLADFVEFEKITAYYGAINSLAQALLKITSPGVPDLYQGMELWNLSLVDPDNRRPVDFEARIRALGALKREEAGGELALAKKLLDSWEDGRVKLYLTYKALNFRKERRELFSHGEYTPLDAAGTRGEHLCAFARHLGEDWVLAVVPRFLARMQWASEGGLTVSDSLTAGAGWGETRLVLPVQAPNRWRNIFTGQEYDTAPDDEGSGGSLAIAKILSGFPVALLAGV